MQRLIEMCVVCAGLYLFYALTMKNWNYYSEAQYNALRRECKRLGMSSTYYFIAAPTLLFFNLITGGTFILYWTYRQWRAIKHGFQRTDGQPADFYPWFRTLVFPFSFYALNVIINRTCRYMHKRPTFPAWFWGSIWLVAWAGVATAGKIKPLFYLLACAIPAILQRRLNGLPSHTPPLIPKTKDILAAFVCLLLSAAAAVFLRRAGYL